MGVPFEETSSERAREYDRGEEQSRAEATRRDQVALGMGGTAEFRGKSAWTQEDGATDGAWDGLSNGSFVVCSRAGKMVLADFAVFGLIVSPFSQLLLCPARLWSCLSICFSTIMLRIQLDCVFCCASMRLRSRLLHCASLRFVLADLRLEEE